MAIVDSRSSLREYCLRKLGKPVIEINVDDDQVDDRIDDAIAIFQQFHMDALLKTYISYRLTANDVTNKYITMPNNVIGVTRIFPLSAQITGSDQSGNFNIFDLNYQLRLNELYDFTSADYVYFELAQEHLRTLEMVVIGEAPIRYNRYDNKLYIDMQWGVDAIANTYIISEAFVVQGEDTAGFWNDRWLKAYTTALIKEQWGNNLKKHKNVMLPGNIMLSGQEIFDEAQKEKMELEIELHERYELPPEWLIG